ncbi:phytanoyl-CoA dioxygenase family protein [Pelomonas sp. KK5]|uniref:phytanoyl-CoA dioxygenase family protein n=1 Tax=Pelomonas sp. KK5 TaxID=1855730 RepID=UPI00097BE581|nr:phytanoyl-CoA dioxygenase family protein [Pelomonas sp. KK5]
MWQPEIDDLARLVRAAEAPLTPLAAASLQGVPVYDCATGLPHDRAALMAEWATVFAEGAGVLVLRQAFAEHAIVDAATARFREMIDEQRRSGTGGGDHFARPGANDRVWNALQKLCLRDPALFAAYYANPVLDAVCEAWLGPHWQLTSQVNCVNPGGAAQTAHRDYHLGFMDAAQAARYPAHVHTMLSPRLTLQGAVAHVDMPLASGPTLYLPHSQKFPAGYLAPGQPGFQAFFDAHHVQLPLAQGDAVFFNPALMHAAGHNRSSSILRLANLLQVSSAFGRAMEAVDREAMSIALYPVLLERPQLRLALRCCAEGYAFPTNLDLDPPLGGLAPPSAQALMAEALDQRWPPARFEAELRRRAALRQA